jgi:hypothetical protein
MNLFFAAVTALSLIDDSAVRALLNDLRGKPVAQRVDRASAAFLGTHYVLDPFGEGADGKYDRDPRYRFDAFDCTTYVETTMALALADDFESFKNVLDRIRYRDGVVGYTTRNHFPEADWIPNNERAGFVRDITARIAGLRDVDRADTIIDKRGWYEHLKISQINVPGATRAEREALLEDLHREGAAFGRVDTHLPYIPLTMIFQDGEHADHELLARIPSGALLAVVRPGWDPGGDYGTLLSVSHQALIIRKGDVPYVRHATTGTSNAVVEVPLETYLHGLLHHPTIRGINLLEIAR